MGKICQSFQDATIVDAFAGPGRYSDGAEGSPLVIARTFLSHGSHARFGRLRLLLVEERDDRRQWLAKELASLPTSPKLQIPDLLPGGIANRFEQLDSFAHVSSQDAPTVWVLDPFKPSGTPFSLVQRCLKHGRDEVLVTWFADELYRFATVPAMAKAANRLYGDNSWTAALDAVGESARKEALLKAYCRRLESLPNVYARPFSISGKNETARYSLVFATHSVKGLECFNPVAWRLDPFAGHHVSDRRPVQAGLFDDTPHTTTLRAWLVRQQGQAIPFGQLLAQTHRLGFVERHLRAELNLLAAEGRAVRESPLKARSRWPADSMVRFYPEADAEDG
jgi:three-Cys-motif partner protein